MPFHDALVGVFSTCLFTYVDSVIVNVFSTYTHWEYKSLKWNLNKQIENLKLTIYINICILYIYIIIYHLWTSNLYYFMIQWSKESKYSDIYYTQLINKQNHKTHFCDIKNDNIWKINKILFCFMISTAGKSYQ